MPFFRDSNGKVVNDTDDEPTRKVDNTSRLFDNTTADIPPPPVDARSNQIDEPVTTLMGGRRKKSAPTTADNEADSNPMDDPVVGWLVIVEGAGQGTSLRLGYGMNNIGRGDTERICLNFGDANISRTKHAIITYDPRGRKFYGQHGGGTNLTYLNDAPLLAPTELMGGEEILLGDTKLKFIPFCGADFDWQQD
jgi:hypothetical protein